MRTITIKVTAEDILAGVREDSKRCPIALACKRVGLASPDVDGFQVEDIDEKGALPGVAIDFVEHFDLGVPVKPFEFELNLKDLYSENDEEYFDE